ncbi:hypothetical protein K1T71_002173 [Dendrolimus kikuchii]|uniref:Uncharacterized protein n=1 Tax=Dendrolimus kikuchii TaxID=765133 RepID=A0ACC1DFR2_9NEOP|nr:hypothetical protein K1T71_002173 [Dendrolimus kikuchii]
MVEGAAPRSAPVVSDPRRPIMGREVLVAVLCCLTLGDVLANQSIKQVKESESTASVPRLYRNVPIGVYASAAPHGAFSFQIPTFAQIKTAASRLIPVKEEATFIQNTNAFLKDSYGNRFVETPQNVAFKTTFPQQFVQLQDLPLHLSQPLTAASPNFELKPTQFVIGPHYKLPMQAAPARYGVPQTVVFSENVKSFAPSQGFGVPQSLIPAQTSAPAHSHITHATQHSAAPSQQFAATLNFAAPHNFGTSYSFVPSTAQTHPKAEQQSTSNKAVYSNTQAPQHFENLKSDYKFQRLEEAPKESQALKKTPLPTVHSENAKLQEVPTEHTVTTVVNGQKTTVSLQTNPPIPLLDISLLEPLTFKNPLVPQVQHFLPRINQATYHKLPSVDEATNYQKEFMVQKTKSYDSGIIKGKPQKDNTKKKPKKTQSPKDEEPVQPQHKGTPHRPSLDESPEITYEINMPGYKETYKEQAIKYNKETQSEPVHYTYGSKTEKDPVTYSYVHHSKEPLQVKEIHYQSDGKGPLQLIYNFNPEEKHTENESPAPQQAEHSRESQKSEGDQPKYHNVEHHNSHHQESPRNYNQPAQYHEPAHHRDENSYQPNHVENDKRHHHEELRHPKAKHEQEKYRPNQAHYGSVQQSPEYYPQALQSPVTTAEYHPLNQYEDEIRFLPPIKSESIRVDPNQHIQKHPQSQSPSPETSQNPHPSSAPHDEQYTPIQKHSYSNTPPQHIHEKSKRIIIQEETPEEMHSLREQLKAEMIDEEENNEEDFEKAYKNAAVGFPAYYRKQTDEEKDIYNPESYGIPREHSDYHIDHSPFQQYQRDGDEYPKEARLNYKDARDSMKEDYFLDYSVSKPKSLTDRYTKKADYYKLYKKQRPEKLFASDEDKKKEKSAKYTAIPYDYPAKTQKPKGQYFAQYKAAPHVYEYDYSKETPRDNSAHASRPFQRYKSKTFFVEPQFQYGFEPVAIPRLLDSELAAMASNNSPESEKPGMRKKLYKENWYIKKTSTRGGKPAS